MARWRTWAHGDLAMKPRLIFPGLLAFVLWGCGSSGTPTPAPVASASASASSVPAKPTVQRKTKPAVLRVADEKDCLAGKADACRRMADRYRGYGHPAGCGLERDLSEMAHGNSVESMRVRIKRSIEDQDDDDKAFLVWIAKACDLGDEEACIIERSIREANQYSITFENEGPALRSDPQTSALLGFQALFNPSNHEEALTRRKKCLLESRVHCWNTPELLMNRVKKELRPELTPELLDKLEALGKRSLDYASLRMMLDKHGYTPTVLEPFEANARKTLIAACEEGACVCGDAAQSLPADDPRVPDLARWGCENGEVAGCYMLAKLHEEGRGVEKDELFARSLYELACPAAQAASTEKWGDYSAAACSRLAEIAEGGVMPPKYLSRAVHYAEYACRKVGYERDHTYCVKLAKYWTSGVLTNVCEPGTGDWCKNGAQRAESLLHGPQPSPFDGEECLRPSVKALCEKVETEVEALKKPAGKKKK